MESNWYFKESFCATCR